MANQWYYAREGNRFGPFGREQLEQLAAQGELLPSDNVWGDEFREWLEAAAIPGLFATEIMGDIAGGATAAGASAALALSGLALRHVCEIAAGNVLSDAAGAMVNYLRKYFSDQSERLPKALKRANGRAWRTLELSLAGEGFWGKVKEKAARAEDKAFLQKIRQFMDEIDMPALAGKTAFRQQCLDELRAAKQDDRLSTDSLMTDDLAQQSVDFARYNDPQKLLDTEWHMIGMIAANLRGDFPNLAWLLEQRPAQGPSLLVTAARYYFRREVEENDALFQGLMFTQMENLTKSQQAGFDWLIKNGKQVDVMLAGIREAVEQTRETAERIDNRLVDVQQTGAAAHAGVLRIEEELQNQDPKFQQIYQAVLDLQNKLDMRAAEPQAGVSISIRSDEEKRQIKAFLQQYRSVSARDRQDRPALLNAVAQLEAAAGEFDAAEQDFQNAAALVTDTEAQAEIHYNRYLSYLESGEWGKAMEALYRSANAVPERFAPFPLYKYEPKRILGAGGFGVAFLCENKNTGVDVVLKTLRAEGAGMDVKQVFQEARVLGGLRHPSIIQLFDCDYADSGRRRAYFVMEYFDPQTLENHVEKNGPMPLAEFLSIAAQMAEGLQAAHERGVLHRDVKPANLLIRKEGAGWQLKLIDFGLAVAHGAAAKASTARRKATESGHDYAGTLDYAAPEQMGRLEGVKVGPRSDVFGFGKTSCFALFGTTQPLPRHFRTLPEPLTLLLESCLEEDPNKRPSTFAEVLKKLRNVQRNRPVAAKKPPAVSWFVMQDGKRQGPISQQQLLQRITEGKVSPQDLVWQTGMTAWQPASSFAELFPTVKGAAPPAVRPAPKAKDKSAPPSVIPAPPQSFLANVDDDEEPHDDDPITAELIADDPNATRAVGTIHLHGVGGANSGGELDVYIDEEKLGTGTALAGFHLDFNITIGHHVLKIKGRHTGANAQLPGTEQVFPLYFSKPGRFAVTLGFGGVTGLLRKVNLSGATPPTSIDVKRLP